MTEKWNAGGRETGPRNEDAALANGYAEASSLDAYHERDPECTAQTPGRDPTLVAAHDADAVASTETTHPDALIDARGIAPGDMADGGDLEDRLKCGLEPGEMSAEAAEEEGAGTGAEAAQDDAGARRSDRTLHLFGDRVAASPDANPDKEQSR